MTEEKNTTYMRIEVDLQCPRCRKKIKKVLCKFPQIRDQVYDEKENCVVIKVVCCCPEKVKQKIICKGGDTIKNIKIIEIEKEKKKKEEKKPPEKEKEEQPEKEKKKDSKPVSKPPPGPVCVRVRPGTCCTECCEGWPWPPLTPRPHVGLVPLPIPVPVPAYPVVFGTCCTECYEGRDGGPCRYGHGRPTPCYGRPIYDSYGGGYGSCYTYVGLCEETSSGCTIM